MKIDAGAVVCIDAELSGEVSVGDGCVIHPRASLIGAAGPLVLGTGNIVEERALIATAEDRTLKIGNNNVFEVGCRVESISIGDANIVEARAILGAGTVIGNGCCIGAGVVIPPGTVVPDHTVIWGSNREQRRIEESMEVS